MADPAAISPVMLWTSRPSLNHSSNARTGRAPTVACRELEISLPHYLRYVVPRAAVGALPVLALLLWFKLGLEVQSMTGLIAAGSAMVVLFGVIWVCFVYRNDPYVDLRPRLGRLRAWSRA